MTKKEIINKILNYSYIYCDDNVKYSEKNYNTFKELFEKVLNEELKIYELKYFAYLIENDKKIRKMFVDFYDSKIAKEVEDEILQQLNQNAFFEKKKKISDNIKIINFYEYDHAILNDFYPIQEVAVAGFETGSGNIGELKADFITFSHINDSDFDLKMVFIFDLNNKKVDKILLEINSKNIDENKKNNIKINIDNIEKIENTFKKIYNGIVDIKDTYKVAEIVINNYFKYKIILDKFNTIKDNEVIICQIDSIGKIIEDKIEDKYDKKYKITSYIFCEGKKTVFTSGINEFYDILIKKLIKINSMLNKNDLFSNFFYKYKIIKFIYKNREKNILIKDLFIMNKDIFKRFMIHFIEKE